MLRTGVLQDNIWCGPLYRAAASNGDVAECLWRVWARRLVSWLGCDFSQPSLASCHFQLGRMSSHTRTSGSSPRSLLFICHSITTPIL